MSFKSFSLPYTIIYFYLLLLHLLTNFEKAYSTDTLLRISFIVIGRYSLVPTSQNAQKLTCQASGTILQNHRRLPVSVFSFAASVSLDRVTRMIFKISE